MVTIKELSESIGVSKVGISKWIERNGYKERLEKDGNKFVIPADLEQVIRSNFAHRETKLIETSDNTSAKESNLTDEILALLREQLQAKDKEIERLHQQVDNLQKINADMVKAVRELNTIQAMQLTDGTTSEQREPLHQSGREAVEKAHGSKEEAKRISLFQRIKRALN